MSGCRVHQRRGHKLQGVERPAIVAQCKLVVGAALHVFEDEARHATHGALAQISNGEGALQIATPITAAVPGHVKILG